MAQKVAVVSGDVLPLPGYPTSGAGLRAWGLGQGLRANGFEVTFLMPSSAVRPEIKLVPEDEPRLWDPYTLELVLHSMDIDAVVFGHWPSVQIKKRLDVPTVIDFHGPHMLERALQGFGDPVSNALPKIEALRKADYFICAGEKQKAYFLGWLLASGFDLTRECIDVVPVCLSPNLPTPMPSADKIAFVYGGISLPWQDPSIALESVAKALLEHQRGTLYFFGGKHPSIPSETLQISPVFRELETRFRNHPHVRFAGMQSRDKLIEIYTHATAAVDLMAYNYERELAFTTRTVEYLWCGLPVIYNNYSDLSALISEYNAGWVLDPQDRASIETVVGEILVDPARAAERGQNAQRLARERLTWDLAVKPLVDFLKTPQMQTQLSQDLVTVVGKKLGTDDFWSRWTSIPTRGIGQLLRAMREHFRQGGVSQLTRATARFIKRRVYG